MRNETDQSIATSESSLYLSLFSMSQVLGCSELEE